MKKTLLTTLLLFVGCSTSPQAPTFTDGGSDAETQDIGRDGAAVDRDVASADLGSDEGAEPTDAGRQDMAPRPIADRYTCTVDFVPGMPVRTCTAPFSLENAVPFISLQGEPPNGAPQHWTASLQFDDRVVIVERPPNGNGPMTVTVEVVSFDPSFAVVQSAPVRILANSTDSLVSFGAPVDPLQTFFVTGLRVAADGPPASAAIRVKPDLASQGTLEFHRELQFGTVDGTAWAVTAVGGSFTVQHELRSNGIVPLDFPFEGGETFTLGLYSWAVAPVDASDASMSCVSTGSSFACTEPGAAIVTVAMQLVRFSRPTVQHLPSIPMASLMAQVQMDPPNRIPTTGAITPAGMVSCNIDSGADIGACLVRLETVGSLLTQIRSETHSTANVHTQAIAF